MERLAKEVYEGKTDAKIIDEGYILSTYKELNVAAEKGYGKDWLKVNKSTGNVAPEVLWRRSSGTLEVATASRMVTTAASVWRKSKDRGIAATRSKTTTAARRVWHVRARATQNQPIRSHGHRSW